MKLTQDQVDFFFENGYLRYGPLLEGPELELLRNEYDHEFSKASETGLYRNILLQDDSTEEEKQSAPQQMLQIMNVGCRNIHYRLLAYDERILDIVQDLIGPNIMLFHDQALFKPAHHGGPVHWHQDNAYWRCAPANLVSCWITLDDVCRENGAMQVIPGSHLKPARHTARQDGSALLNTDTGGREASAVVIDLPAGGCMFHHCQTLHYTQPNSTDRQRRAFAIHFMTPGTRRLDGALLSVDFAHPMLRMRI